MTSQIKARLDNDLLDSLIEFEDNIQKISLSAPNGKRKISSGESTQIVYLLNSRFCEVIQQSDECKSYDSKKEEMAN